jgi:dTDP-4-dehydrorhamnose reductase
MPAERAPRLLLTGATGQLGFELQRALAPLGELVTTSRDGRLPGGAACSVFDLDAPASLVAVLDRWQPDIVVNAAAWTAVDRAEQESSAAFRANAEAPATIAGWCAANDALLVHYSTDYVFDGRGSTPWTEQAPTAPLGVYGASKRAGEQAIIDSRCPQLILRTAWVYAARGQNFLRTMLRLGAERDRLRVVADQIGAPTPARWLAAATAALLARGRWREPGAQGLFHLAAGGATSWHGFAEAIFADALQAGLLERAPLVEPIASSDYPTPAARPGYSVLDCTRLADIHGIALPDWRRGVAEVIAELASS